MLLLGPWHPIPSHTTKVLVPQSRFLIPTPRTHAFTTLEDYEVMILDNSLRLAMLLGNVHMADEVACTILQHLIDLR